MAQQRTFQQNFKDDDDRQKTSISQLKDDLHKEIDPLVEKQRQTDKEMVSLKEQMDQNSKETQKNRQLLQTVLDGTQEQIKTANDLSAKILEIQVKQNVSTPDPHHTSQLRKRFFGDLQHEICVLTVQNCTDTQDGKPGWISILSKWQFRNHFTSESFPTGVLQLKILSGN